MADNVTLNTNTTSGAVIASDDIGGVQYQRVKLALGADGVASDAPIGGGVESGSLRVTLASDSTGVLSVDDNGGSLTVDGTVTINAIPAGTNNIGDVDVLTVPADPFGANADAASATGSISAKLRFIAGTGIPITSLPTLAAVTNVATIGTSVTPGTGATNLGKAEDAAHASGDVGVLALGVRQDTLASSTSADGDYAALKVSSAGRLYVDAAITSGAGSGGTSVADAAAFTRGTTSVTPVAGVVETSAPTLTNGNTGALSLTTGGAVRVAVASGGVAGVVEDAASAGGEEGILCMTVRQDTIASTTSADGDFQNAKTNSVGALYSSLSHLGANAISTGNGTAGTGCARVTIASDNTAFTVNLGTGGTGATSLGKAEDAAAASGDTGVAVFAVRRDTPSSDVSAAGDYATLQVNSTGSLWTAPAAATTGGCSFNSIIAPATPAKNVLTSAASQVYSITAFNLLATPVYLKIWNNVTASVTLGTTACDYQFMIPGNTGGAGFAYTLNVGIPFSTGIITAVTGAISTTDNTSITANSVIVNVAYK